MEKTLANVIKTILTWGTIVIVIALCFFAVLAVQHYRGIGESNDRLVELRERQTPSVFQDRVTLRLVSRKKFSVTGFCQSSVSAVSKDATLEFVKKYAQGGFDEVDLAGWEQSPTNGYFANCFKLSDQRRLEHLLSSEGAIVGPTGGGADYTDFPRWITNFHLFDPQTGLLYQATQTGILAG